MKTHFDRPTQVLFFDIDTREWLGGIAVDDYIICGRDGARILTESLHEGWIVELTWLDISAEIKGN